VSDVLVDPWTAQFCATRRIAGEFAGFAKIRSRHGRLGGWCAGCKSGVGPCNVGTIG
jgi:hypothetical protein